MAKSPIPRQSLASAVVDKLRDQIILGELTEGAQLRQDVIAAEFQVSRIPVREAFRQLLAEGLIDINPNRGAVVSVLEPAEIEELFQIRAVLEPEVLRASIPHLTESDLAEAAAVERRFRDDLQRSEDVGAWGRLNTQFHAALYAGARMPQFRFLLRTVNNNSERYTRLQLYLTHRHERAVAEHDLILEHCRAGDADAACALLREHVLNAGRSLRTLLETRRTAQIAER
ncbi:MAG: GntR family transcriptional regulator [Terriglobales bacterium]